MALVNMTKRQIVLVSLSTVIIISTFC